jgi:putative spermidine/putrescine transport system permease protein
VRAPSVTLMLAPILITCAVASTPEGYLSFPSNGLLLRWFKAIASYPEFVTAFETSLILAAVSATCALAVSIPAALAIAGYDFWGRAAISALFVSPPIIPQVVLGIARSERARSAGRGGPRQGIPELSKRMPRLMAASRHQ